MSMTGIVLEEVAAMGSISHFTNKMVVEQPIFELRLRLRQYKHALKHHGKSLLPDRNPRSSQHQL